MKTRLKLIALIILLCISATSCKAAAKPISDNVRTWYEVFVYSFADSDGNGVGDINGLTQKLDYIEDLGFNGIWLMPIFPSPTYHKYDASDYMNIDTAYGTMEDFDALVAECNKRDIKIIIDLALNHSSSEHPWFKNAVQALREGDENNKYIGYYNFVNGKPDEQGYAPANAGDWYYECMFWDGMPDFNLANTHLRAEIESIMRFWLDKGVAGFRLDAVKEFYSGETQKNIDALKWVNDTAKAINPQAYLVCENWDTTTGIYDYYSSDADSFFDFPFSGANGIIAKTLIDTTKPAQSLAKAAENAQAAILAKNPQATNASFFTNHDSPRAAGFLRRSPELIKTAWGINLMQTGQAFVYYGEELGMSGSGKDENKRAPMYWSEDKSAENMCFGPPAMQAQEHFFGSAEQQMNDKDSIYSYVKRVLEIRNQYPAIARGIPLAIDTQSGLKLCFIEKSYNGERIVLAYNLGAEEQKVDIAQLNVKKTLATLAASADDKASVKANLLTMPPYSITVLK